MHASQLDQPMKASAIAEVGDELVNDAYHELMLTGARRMVSLGLGHWEYRTGWGASTLWGDPNSDRTMVVYYDGSYN